MKHGDKAKAKAAKASKPSDNKVSSKTVSGKGKAEGESRETAAKAGSEKGSSKASGESRAALAQKAGTSTRGRGDDNGARVFANPLIAAAFKRAVKKYANTFRRLTD